VYNTCIETDKEDSQMNCNVTLTADEFKALHNALYALDCLNTDGVSEQVEVIRSALKGAYEQETQAFDRKYVHYDRVRKELGLDAIWSIYEVDNLSDRHSFENVTRVVYKDHWGNKEVASEINGGTWAALFVAANACIRDSGDEHHVFIEHFKQFGDTLVLTTGS
jgi:hypothetical protein